MNLVTRILNYIHWHRTHWVRVEEVHHELLLRLFAELRPHVALGKTKVRVGGSRDGGYVMIDDFVGIKAAVSLGIGPNVSWDMEVAKKGIPVLQFDHTVEGPPEKHPLFWFAKKRISTEPSEDCVTLDSVLTGLFEEPFFLKMDIEGDEWDVLDHLNFQLLNKCPQLVLELHDFSRASEPDWCARALRVLSRISKKFGVVHVHGNNLSKHLLVSRLCLPDCLEVTFANRGYFTLAETTETFPGRLDKMNNPAFPDFNLGQFRFDHQ